MTIELIGTYAVALCLLIGGSFALIGTIGLLRFPDSMTRLHAPTKVGTIGIGALLLASMIHSWTFEDGSLHELLIMAFLFVTAPISANFIGKVNLHRRSCDTPPPPPRDNTWSTFDSPENEESAQATGS
jgi:multicomponent K+:H+ antiporter subunit G